MPQALRFAVVGAGIVGLATARELARRHPDSSVTVLEKEPAPALHQSSHNSGVVHAGLYYPPGSLKAELCTRGRRLMQEFCETHDLPYQECGKLVVATDASQLPRLEDIEKRARSNGVPRLRRLGAGELREVEPNVAGVAGLHSPHTAITDFGLVARTMAQDPRLDVRPGFEVVRVEERAGEAVLFPASGSPFKTGRTTAGAASADPVVADRVIRCAGLRSPSVVAFRGEYWRLKPERSKLVRGLIYPVPDPRYPFLGVHVTRRVSGDVDLGPNAVLALALEGYRRRDVDPRYLVRLVTDPSVWRMAGRNWRAGAYELAGSLSKRVFVERATALVPGVTADDVVRAPAGVRAQALDPDGSLVDDFRISRSAGGRVLTVANAPSPAATSSLAIAEHICDQVDRR